MRFFFIQAVILIVANSIFAQSAEQGSAEMPYYPNYSYDSPLNSGGSLIKSITRQVWDASSGVWNNDSLYTYSYNGNGQCDTLIYQKWNVLNDAAKRVYIYNNNKLHQTRTYFYWGSWVYYARDDYYYASNNLTEHDIFIWAGGSTFQPVNRLTYQYNANNQVVNWLTELYDDFYMVWRDAWMIDYSYDSLYRLSETVEYIGRYTLHNRDLYSYDSLSNDYQDVGQEPQGNAWVNDYLYAYEIDPDSFLTRLTYLDWAADSSGWNNVWRQDYSYNSAGNISAVLKEVWADSVNWQYSRNRIVHYDENDRWIEDVRYYWNDTGWVNNVRYLAAWLDPVSVNDEVPAAGEFSLLQNFPNPFNPVTTITYQVPEPGLVTLKVYDVLGREISVLVNDDEEPGRHSIDFDASSLASGVYIYQLRINDFSASKKMTVLK